MLSHFCHRCNNKMSADIRSRSSRKQRVGACQVLLQHDDRGLRGRGIQAECAALWLRKSYCPPARPNCSNWWTLPRCSQLSSLFPIPACSISHSCPKRDQETDTKTIVHAQLQSLSVLLPLFIAKCPFNWYSVPHFQWILWASLNCKCFV